MKAQLTELLTHYGEITALIIDGWSAAWSRIYYDQLPFRTIYDHIKSLQPNCLVADHNFGTYPVALMYYTDIKEYEQHAGQLVPQDSVIPSQSGTTLQSDWFWKKDYPNQALRPAKQIVEEWLLPLNERHCNLTLNVAPNTDGRFDENAVARLAEVGRLWKNLGSTRQVEKSIQITTPNLAFAAPSYASSIADTSGPDLANDNSFRSAWTADEGQTDGWVEINFKQPIRLNTMTIIASGQQDGKEIPSISSYRAEYWVEGAPVLGDHDAGNVDGRESTEKASFGVGVEFAEHGAHGFRGRNPLVESQELVLSVLVTVMRVEINLDLGEARLQSGRIP